MKKPKLRNNQFLKLNNPLCSQKSPRRKNISLSRKHPQRSLLKMMKMSQSKFLKKRLISQSPRRSSTNKRNNQQPNLRAMSMTVRSSRVAKRQRSPRPSPTRLHLRRERPTTIALAVDPRINPSAMGLTTRKDAPTSLLSLCSREKMRILMRSRKSVSAAANTISPRRDHSATEATRT